MDWNAIGAIGEVGGAVGVVVTLIYLAGQLRQNTNALRSASYEHWNAQVAEWGHYQGRHAKELAELRAIKNPEELTPAQLNYLLGEFHIILGQGECAFLKHRAGTLDEDVFEAGVQALPHEGQDGVGRVPCQHDGAPVMPGSAGLRAHHAR